METTSTKLFLNKNLNYFGYLLKQAAGGLKAKLYCIFLQKEQFRAYVSGRLKKVLFSIIKF